MKSIPAERCLARSDDNTELWANPEGDLRLQQPHPTIPGSFLIQPLTGRNLGVLLDAFAKTRDLVFRLSRLEHPELPVLPSTMWVVSFQDYPLTGFCVEPLSLDQAVEVLTAVPDLPVICVGDTLCTLPSTFNRHQAVGRN